MKPHKEKLIALEEKHTKGVTYASSFFRTSLNDCPTTACHARAVNVQSAESEMTLHFTLFYYNLQ
jgi:hypothetical protein